MPTKLPTFSSLKEAILAFIAANCSPEVHKIMSKSGFGVIIPLSAYTWEMKGAKEWMTIHFLELWLLQKETIKELLFPNDKATKIAGHFVL